MNYRHKYRRLHFLTAHLCRSVRWLTTPARGQCVPHKTYAGQQFNDAKEFLHDSRRGPTSRGFDRISVKGSKWTMSGVRMRCRQSPGCSFCVAVFSEFGRSNPRSSQQGNPEKKWACENHLCRRQASRIAGPRTHSEWSVVIGSRRMARSAGM